MIDCMYAYKSPLPELIHCKNHTQIMHNGLVNEHICKNICPYKRPKGDFFQQTNWLAITKFDKPISTQCCGSEPKLIKQTQTIKMEKNKKAFNPVPIIQITDTCKRHLTYHIYPTLHSPSWKWNIDQLCKYWSLFNGSKALAIVYDKKTYGPESVKQYLSSKGMQFDHIFTKRNDTKLREVKTWLPLLETINVKGLSNNDFIFSAHAKGVRHETQEPHIKYWALCMYHANLHDWNIVRRYLEQHLAVGAFRRFNAFNTVGNFCWHFSGTFFWWRPYDIINRGNWKIVDQAFYGTESWLGHQMPPEHAACLFNDNCDDLYHKRYWDHIVLPQWYKLYDKDSLNEQ